LSFRTTILSIGVSFNTLYVLWRWTDTLLSYIPMLTPRRWQIRGF
jgi:hypothetical protein